MYFHVAVRRDSDVERPLEKWFPQKNRPATTIRNRFAIFANPASTDQQTNFIPMRESPHLLKIHFANKRLEASFSVVQIL